MTASTAANAQFKFYNDGTATIARSVQSPYSYFSAGENTYNLYNAGYRIGMHVQAPTTGTYTIGLSANCVKSSLSGRCIGVCGIAGGGTTGYNYGVLGALSGTSHNGAGIFGTITNSTGVYINGQYAGYFDGNTKVNGTLTATSIVNSSDIRLKENVISLSSIAKSQDETLGNVMNMNVIKYNFKDMPVENSDTVQFHATGKCDKKQLHYGLSAQELRELYPDLVYEGQDGYLGINYIELVPILIRSIQELKQELDDVKGKGYNDIQLLRSSTTSIQTVPPVTKNILYQNTPNPFKEETTIRFSLADGVQNAAICIFDLSGKLVKRIPISSGESSINVPGYEIGEGIFLYTLMVNGQEIDTKRMILTK